MNPLNSLIWNFENETEGNQPWFSIDACCGGPSDGRGTGGQNTSHDK